MKRYSSSQAAKLIGVTLRTLQAWIRERKITAPKITRVLKWRVRLWTAEDIKRVKRELKRK